MKGPVTRWVCDRCDETLTTYVRLSEPPTHVCRGANNTSKEGQIQPMIPKGKK